MPSTQRERVLLVVAPYYRDIADQLVAGATAALDEAGFAPGRIDVPGAFEIPAAIAAAARSGAWAGYVALGCVIRGETSHYEHICAEVARALMELSVREGLAIGFGVLTVESEEQARVRAAPDGRNKGGEAAHAALAMIELQRGLAGDAP